MNIVVEIELTFDTREEFEEAMEQELIQGDLNNFLFAELCQNYDLGMLTGLCVKEVEETQ